MRRSHRYCSVLAIATCAHAASAEEPRPQAEAVVDSEAARATSAPSRASDVALPPPARESWLVPSLHALGLMSVMRGSEAYLWPEPFAKTGQFGYHYGQAFTRPPLWDGSRPLFEEDGDRWQINVLGHGAFGSELYLRVRTCRKPVWQALLFTAAASTTWEYGFEGNGVRPSALDLVYTPLSGLLLGEGRFQLLSAARRMSPGAGRTVLKALVDPLGELERAAGTPC